MYYQMNRETQKLELIFSKEEYTALSKDQQREIKSNFLFSRSLSGWVSRAKFPSLYFAERVAKSLGAEGRGKTGESLSFGEQQERKAERAEARAERMEYRSERAAAEGERLQKPIEDMHGDIAFFTQPNINTSAGRAFTRRREKMRSAWERGWESFKKSEYYAERAEIAKRTAADATAPTDKGFCERRIAEAEKTIRAQKKNLDHYRGLLNKLNAGEQIKLGYGDEYLNIPQVERWIEDAEEITEQAMSKAIYYRDSLESLGGIQFSRENVKPGYIVKFRHWGRDHVGEVLSCGPKNLFIKDFVQISFADVVEIVEKRELQEEQHPFKTGDTFTPDLWNQETRRIEKTPVEIVKATVKTVTVKNTRTGETCTRKPRKRSGACYEGGYIWEFFIDDSYSSGCFKKATA